MPRATTKLPPCTPNSLCCAIEDILVLRATKKDGPDGHEEFVVVKPFAVLLFTDYSAGSCTVAKEERRGSRRLYCWTSHPVFGFTWRDVFGGWGGSLHELKSLRVSLNNTKPRVTSRKGTGGTLVFGCESLDESFQDPQVLYCSLVSILRNSLPTFCACTVLLFLSHGL